MAEGPEFKHSYTRRKWNHDYHAPCTYHIILKKLEGREPFSHIIGDAKIAPGQPGCADVKWSPLGRVIADAIHRFHTDFPIIAMYAYCVMPDHVHISLRVTERSKFHLGYYIARLKARIGKDYSQRIGRIVSSEEIFQENYTDKPLYSNRSLDELRTYIRLNPHRLAMRRQYPQFFQRVRKLKIGEREYEAYGNLFLFRNPDKEAVKISRRFSEREKQEKRANWLAEAEQGTILVSPFISKEEKAVRAEAEALGAGIILITHETFPERYKPSAHDFALCSSGRLLIISLGEAGGTALTRVICQRMNALAEALATGRAMPRSLKSTL